MSGEDEEDEDAEEAAPDAMLEVEKRKASQRKRSESVPVFEVRVHLLTW